MNEFFNSINQLIGIDLHMTMHKYKKYRHSNNSLIDLFKVDTVKRLCIKKLPPILAIQLKRFDYDWERWTIVFHWKFENI